MSRPRSLEVVATYKGTVLDAQLLRPGSRYTIGEGDTASLTTPPVDLHTPDAFELARIGRNGAVWIRFAPSMQGEIVFGDRRHSLQAWRDAGRTIEDAGIEGTTLPAGARCRLKHGELTVHLTAVEPPALKLARPEVDVPFWAITAACFVFLSALLVLAHLAMPPSAHLTLEQHARTNRFVGYMRQPDQTRKRPPITQPTVTKPEPLPPTNTPAPVPRNVPVPAPAPVPDPEPPPAEGSSPSKSARRPRSNIPVYARGSVSSGNGMMMRGHGPIEAARSAGILAFVDTREVTENPYANAFSPDTDDRDMWEAQKAIDPTQRSIAGLGLVGKGRGGNPDAVDEIVTSKPEPAAVPEDDDDLRPLIVRAGTAKVRGPRARDAVRSVVVRHVRDLRRCYDQGVDRDPELSGRLTLKLEIEADGDVVSASASRFSDPAVGDCMAAAAKRWRFPESDRPGVSRVSVPLVLRQR